MKVFEKLDKKIKKKFKKAQKMLNIFEKLAKEVRRKWRENFEKRAKNDFFQKQKKLPKMGT